MVDQASHLLAVLKVSCCHGILHMTCADSLAFYLVHKHVERHEVSGDIEVVKVEKKKKVIVREE